MRQYFWDFPRMRILLQNIKELFQKILKKALFGKTTVLILVALDTDALCALKILSELLNKEHIQFRIYPVAGFSEMEECILHAHSVSHLKSLVFLNCGAIYDLTDYWFAQQDVKAYVFDNHQPVHHANLHSQKNVYIIDDGMAELDLCPAAEDIRQMHELEGEPDSDDDLDEDLDDDSLSGSKRKKRKWDTRDKLRKKQKKNYLEEKWNNYYLQGNYYSRPTATVIYTLALQLSHENNDLLWYAVLGLTDTYIHGRLSQKYYEHLLNEFSNEVMRLNTENPEESEQLKRIGGIFLENDYRFMLLRSQSLYDAMYYSSYMGTKLNIWRNKDFSKLDEFIVRLGIPMEQAKQKYMYMSQKNKKNLKEKIVEVSQKFGLNEILYRSFMRQLDSKVQVSAADMVHCLQAFLEFPPHLLDQYVQEFKQSLFLQQMSEEKVSERSKNFWLAFDALNLNQIALLQEGFNMALEFQKALVNESIYLIDKKEILSTRNYKYAILKSETLHEQKFFQHPHSLQKLALMLMDIYKGYQLKKQSIVLCIQIHQNDTFMVIGVVGAKSFSLQEKNLFGTHFLHTAQSKQYRYKQDNFETSVIEIQKNDFHQFMDSLLEFQQ